MKIIAMVLTAGAFCLAGAACADPPKKAPPAPQPVKVSAAEALGPVFSRPTAVKENGADGPATSVPLLVSHDKKFEAGLFSAGPIEVDIASYEDDEFMYFLEGGVTLTSADGTVLEAREGEGVVIPKGWRGHWSTHGYKKYYVTYAGGGSSK